MKAVASCQSTHPMPDVATQNLPLIGAFFLLCSACVDLTPPWDEVPPATGHAGTGGSLANSSHASVGSRGDTGAGGCGCVLNGRGTGGNGGTQTDAAVSISERHPSAVAVSPPAVAADGRAIVEDASVMTKSDLGAGGSGTGSGGIGGNGGSGGGGTGDRSAPELRDAATDPVATDARVIQGAPTFHCGNWADQRDNFVKGNLVLSGLAATDDHATVLAKATAILGALKNNVGLDSVRVPINEPTASGAWWNSYKGVIDASLAQGMKVIVTYWAWHNGKEDSRSAYFAMWKTVVDAYLNNDGVYFELFNNPYGYKNPTDFITFAAQWLATYPSVPKGRVIVAGSGYNDQVILQGADSRLAGTLLSLQIYPFYSPHTTSNADWTKKLKSSLGGYESRTIVTSWGAPMTTKTDYSGAGDGDNSKSFLSAISTYLRSNHMGSCYWPILRTSDTWTLTTVKGTGTNLSLDITNASGLKRVKATFGF